MKVPLTLRYGPDGRVTKIMFPKRLGVFCIDKAYVRIAIPWSRYVNRIVFGGRWKDQKGRTFSFSESGQVHWPGRQPLRYKVSLDSVGATCDLISIDTLDAFEPHRQYGFKRTKNELLFFRVILGSGSGAVDCEHVPVLILKKE